MRKSRVIMGVVAIVLAILAVLSTKETASAVSSKPHVNTKPCVSKQEFRGTKHSMSRKEIETRLEVVGLGVRDHTFDMGQSFRTWIYPRCGFDFSNPGNRTYYGFVFKEGHGLRGAISGHVEEHIVGGDIDGNGVIDINEFNGLVGPTVP